MRNHFRRPVFWILALSAGLVCTTLFLRPFYLLLRHNKNRPASLNDQGRLSRYYERSSRVLYSIRPNSEVRILFKEKNATLCLEGVWVGRPTEAIVDTGSATVSWPVSWQLTGVWTDIFFKSGWAGDIVSDNEVVILPTVRIGDFQMENMPTTAFGRAQAGVPSIYAARLAGNVVPAYARAILGAPAFCNLVLTIDYASKRIILRSKTHDVTRLKHRHQDHLFRMSLEGGLPVINGRIAGIPARFGIDTGCGSMPINGSFVKKLPKKTCIFTTDATAFLLDQPTRVKCLTRVSGFIGDLPFIDDNVEILDLPTSADALVGLGFLKHFRVTIDYSRGKVLLEPYPITNSTPQKAN